MCFLANSKSVRSIRRRTKTFTAWKSWCLCADRDGNFYLRSEFFPRKKHGKIFGPGRYECPFSERTLKTFAKNAPTLRRQGYATYNPPYHLNTRGFYAKQRGRSRLVFRSYEISWVPGYLGTITLPVRIRPKDIVRASRTQLAAVSMFVTKAAWRMVERYAKQALKGAVTDAA